MATARAVIESLLRARKLDGTLTDARPWVPPLPEDRVASTGVPAIDEPLGGGLRRGHLSEIVGPRSSGRTTVLCRALAAATSRGEVVAVVDPCDRFDPVSAADAGVDLTRLLWVRLSAAAARSTDARGEAPRALKALNLVLQAGGFGIVAFDLADLPPLVLRQFPCTTWMRLSRVVEGSQTAVVLLGSDRIARSPGGATILLEPPDGGAARWTGTTHRARLLAGLHVRTCARGTWHVTRIADDSLLR